MIEPVADRLLVPRDRIYANTLLFAENGSYKDFDPNEPTSREEGGREGGAGRGSRKDVRGKGAETRSIPSGGTLSPEL